MELLLKLILISAFAGLTPGYSQSALPYDGVFSDSYGAGEFTVRGKVSGMSGGQYKVRFAVSGYLDNYAYSVDMREDGSFEGRFPVTDVQELYLYLGDAVTLLVYPDAELVVEFDPGDIPASISVSSPDPVYDRDLQLAMEIYRNTRQDYINISMLSYDDEKTDEYKLEQNNAYINKCDSLIREFVEKNGETRFAGISLLKAYYTAATRVPMTEEFLGRLPDSKLVTPDGVKPHCQLDYHRFRTVDEYRRFLKRYAYRSLNLFDSESIPEAQTDSNINTLLNTLLKFDIIYGHVPFIRDCVVSCYLYDKMNEYGVRDITEAYEWYRTKCQEQAFVEEVERVYNTVVSVTVNADAPDFTLPDFNGNPVNLSDFRGKPVYIDFWGMGCGPCMYEFRTSTRELHEKYGEEVTFIYIAVTGEKNALEKVISDYHLEGVHLIAEGWSSNPACQAYNVQGIPHYVLIDAEGKIVSPSARRPSQMLAEGDKSELGKLTAR